LKNELAEIEKEEEEGSLTATMLRRKNFIQTEFLRALKEEEMYWHKRSNQNWLLQGDNNTEYFHRFANGKKRKNMIFQIERGDEILHSEKEILAHASDYYKNLFGHAEKPLFSLDPECWT
jgi:4-hydroxyphenylpyruvate dioxygenase-like putative hemolysin